MPASVFVLDPLFRVFQPTRSNKSVGKLVGSSIESKIRMPESTRSLRQYLPECWKASDFISKILIIVQTNSVLHTKLLPINVHSTQSVSRSFHLLELILRGRYSNHALENSEQISALQL